MKGFGINKSDTFELFILEESRENVLTIKNDTVRAANSGFLVVAANLYKKCLDNNGEKIILSSWIGLFGLLTDRAYIDGIILEDISIDVSDYDISDIVASPIVRGIAGVTTPGVIVSNCVVNGTIFGSGERTSGIIGENNCGIISKSSYNGTIKVVNNNVVGVFSVGGIAGYNNHGHGENEGWEIISNIIDCTVNADIENSAISGGIIGYTNFKVAVKESYFTGTLVGKYSGTMIGMGTRGSEKPIDFD